MPKTPNIVFDLGNVLIDWDPRHLYRKLLGNETEVEWFLENVCNDEWNIKHDKGQSFDKGISELSKLYPQYTDLIKNWFDRWEEMLGGPMEDSVELLAELKKLGFPLYILSNWSAETYPKAEARYEFLKWFDGKIISGEVGKIKPDPEIFHILTNTYNLNPENSVFIDDKLINIEAANLIGFQGIHFKNAESLRNDLRKVKLI